MGATPRKTFLLEKIVRTSLELTSIISIDDLLHQIVRVAAELTESESAGILLEQDSARQLRFIVATSFEDRLLDIPVPIDGSIAGASFSSGEPILVPDVRQDPRYFIGVEQRTGFKALSLLCVPLRFQERKIGVLEVENKRSRRGFGAQDVEILTALAAQATVAIENARTIEALHQAHRQLEAHLQERDRWLNAEQDQYKLAEALRQAAASLSSTLDFTQVVDRILDQIGQVIPNETSNLMLIEADGFARISRGHGYERYGTADTLGETRVKIDEVPGLQGMIESGKPLVISDVLLDQDWIYSRQEHTWIRSYAGAPIIVQGQVMGFLNVLSDKPGMFRQEDGDRLQQFCLHAAMAITNARLYQQAQEEIMRRTNVEAELRRHRDHLEELVQERTSELTNMLAQTELLNHQLQAESLARQRAQEELRLMAITDALTGVHNRRQLSVLGQQVFNHACRYHRPLAALMVDADHFKNINDSFGHAVGDEVLKFLANYLRQNLREADILGRYGGEEFVALLPETELETAQEVATRLLTGIRELRLEMVKGQVKLTVSIGIGILIPDIDESIDDLVDRADQAMYAAKQAGRNQVAILK